MITENIKIGTEVIWYLKLRESCFHTFCDLKLVSLDRLLPAPTQNITNTRPVISVIFLSISAYSPEWLAKHNFPEGLSYAWQIRKDMILYMYSWSTNALYYLHLHSCLLNFKFLLAFQMWDNINLYRTWKKTL